MKDRDTEFQRMQLASPLISRVDPMQKGAVQNREQGRQKEIWGREDYEVDGVL